MKVVQQDYSGVDVIDIKCSHNEEVSAPYGTIRSNENYADIADLYNN